MTTRFNFTKARLDALPLPAAGERVVYHDADGPQSVHGLQLRVSGTGVKTFYVFKRRGGGKAERVKIGRYPDLSIEKARTEAKKAIAQLAVGESPNAQKKAEREAAAQAQAESLTLASALQQYVDEKVRKDGKPLKERTKGDYLKMVQPAKVKRNGSPSVAGELYPLADKAIRMITAKDIRKVHGEARGRGTRRAAYSMQVLRAVLNWHKVDIADSPFTGGNDKDSIVIPTTDPAPHPLGTKQIGPWWRAARAMPSSPTVDYLMFTLLTGCRPSEPLQVLVGDCDLNGGRVLLRDTKNRLDHTILLSAQALEIVKRQAKDKKPDDRLFPLVNPRKTVLALTEASGIEFKVKDLRSTFAGIAEIKTTAYTLKRMMNHKQQKSDVTGANYVVKEEIQLRNGWQAVADYIEELAANTDNVVPLQGATA